jgi:hypothetical protein
MPFKSFWDELKMHPLFLPRVFLVIFFSPIFSPPTYLPHLISHLLYHHSSRKHLNVNSSELRGNARHKAWGRWKAQHWRNMERRKQEERLIQNAKVNKKRYTPSLLYIFFFFSMVCLKRKQWLNGYNLFLSFFCFCFKHFFFVFCYE